jgi:hypothetical protein
VDDSFDQPAPARLGEVIETSTVRVWAECDELNALPRLGSVVEISATDAGTILAIVSYAETAGLDATRRAIRRGSNDVRDGEIYRRHPELARVLRSTFESVPVAFRQGALLTCVVPPVPPPLHYSVVPAPLEGVLELTDRLDYLPMLARHTGQVPAEQVVIAHIRETFERRGRDMPWLERVAASIGRLYSRQYDLLLPILEAIDPAKYVDTVDRRADRSVNAESAEHR